MGFSFRLTASVLLYASSHRQDSTYHGLCYTSRGALDGTRNGVNGSTMKDWSNDSSHHERTLLPRSYILLPICRENQSKANLALNHILQKYIYPFPVQSYPIGGIAGQSSRCTVKFIQSECNEGCDWCIYVTVVTCDFDIYPMYSVAFVIWWIVRQWHLPLVDIWGGCKYCNWHFVWIWRLPL